MSDQLYNIASNRDAKKYPAGIIIARILWSVGRFVFRLSPRPCFGFRRFILRLFGARVGQQVHIYPSATIYFPWNLKIGDYSTIGEHALVYNLAECVIGERSTISQRVHLCGGSHDYTDPAMRLLKLPITIGDDVWICADAFVSPKCTISNRSVVAARSVVTKDVGEDAVVAGNPATFVQMRKGNRQPE